MDFPTVAWIGVGVLLLWLVVVVVKTLVMRKKMTVTVKLNGAIIVQQVMRLSSTTNDAKIKAVIGGALDKSPLVGATMIGTPTKEKIGEIGRRYVVQVRKDSQEAQLTLEVLPAVV